MTEGLDHAELADTAAQSIDRTGAENSRLTVRPASLPPIASTHGRESEADSLADGASEIGTNMAAKMDTERFNLQIIDQSPIERNMRDTNKVAYDDSMVELANESLISKLLRRSRLQQHAAGSPT